jgi:cell division protein FtsW
MTVTAQRSRLVNMAPRYDLLLMVAVVALLIVGLMMVYSATTFSSVNHQLNEDPNSYFVRQLMWLGLGVVVMAAMAHIKYQFWRRFSVLILALALVLLGAVLVLRSEQFGAARWLTEGGSIQPGEFAKLAVIIYVADWLSSKGERIRQVTYGLIPFAVLVGFVDMLIIQQPNFSTAVLIAATAMVMFFIAGGEWWQILVSFVLGSVPLMLLISHYEHAMKRVVSFLFPLSQQAGDNYQTIQALIALASGGLTGMGLGASRQKFGWLPDAHTDGIFAVLGEELGLIGCLLVLGLFAFLAYRGFRVAMNAPDLFGAVLASGLTWSLILQALVNIAVVTSIAPTTGVTLPFISYGGSSLVTSLASIGLLLSISRGASSQEVTEPRGEKLASESHDLRRGDGGSRVSRPRRRRVVDFRE